MNKKVLPWINCNKRFKCTPAEKQQQQKTHRIMLKNVIGWNVIFKSCRVGKQGLSMFPRTSCSRATVANYTDASVVQIRMEMCSSGYWSNIVPGSTSQPGSTLHTPKVEFDCLCCLPHSSPVVTAVTKLARHWNQLTPFHSYILFWCYATEQ